MLLLFNKNYLLTILLVLLVSVTTTECKEVKTDLQRKNLKGKVKSVRYIDYKAVDKFGELTKGDKSEYNWNNKLTKYDNNGNEIEWNRYNSDGSLDCKYTYKYDNNGNTIEGNRYNSDGSLNYKYTYKYKYDKYGNWIQKIYFEQKGEKSISLPQTITEQTIEYYK